MAILLRGTTRCRICDKVIADGDAVVLFPHFVLNEADPLYHFSDAACHLRCIESNALAKKALAESEQYLAQSGPGKRACAVCGNEIRNPDDYLFISFLADPNEDLLGRFNYTHLHKSHISNWKEADEFLLLAKAAINGGRWQGAALDALVREIEAEI